MTTPKKYRIVPEEQKKKEKSGSSVGLFVNKKAF